MNSVLKTICEILMLVLYGDGKMINTVYLIFTLYFKDYIGKNKCDLGHINTKLCIKNLCFC